MSIRLAASPTARPSVKVAAKKPFLQASPWIRAVGGQVRQRRWASKVLPSLGNVEVVVQAVLGGGLGHGGQHLLRAFCTGAQLLAEPGGVVGAGVVLGRRVELVGVPGHGDLVAMVEPVQRGLEAALADVAPRADDVGPDIDVHTVVNGRAAGCIPGGGGPTGRCGEPARGSHRVSFGAACGTPARGCRSRPPASAPTSEYVEGIALLMAAGKLNQAKSKARSAAYTAFGHLPPRIRRGLVGVVAPSFTVGALAVVHDGDRFLFVTQLHRPGLSLPGGLLKKGEEPRSALARELSEELGLDSSGFAATPDTAHVDAGKKRVDLIFFLDADRSTLTPKVGLPRSCPSNGVPSTTPR